VLQRMTPAEVDTMMAEWLPLYTADPDRLAYKDDDRGVAPGSEERPRRGQGVGVRSLADDPLRPLLEKIHADTRPGWRPGPDLRAHARRLIADFSSEAELVLVPTPAIFILRGARVLPGEIVKFAS